MKKPSSDLFDLIKKMSRTEKRYFMLHANLQQGKKNYMEMFKAIDKMEKYDEQNLLSTLSAIGIQIPQIHVTKNNLSKKILKSLRAYHEKKSIQQKLFALMAEASLLEGKGLLTQCLKKLNVAFELAQENEYYRFQAEIKQMIIDITFKHHGDKDLSNFIHKNYRDLSEIDKSARFNSQARKISHQSYLLKNLKNEMSSPDFIEAIKSIREMEFPKMEPPNFPNFYVERNYLFSNSILNEIEGKRTVEYDRALIVAWKKRPDLIKYKSKEYKRDFYNYLNSCLMWSELKEFEKRLPEFQSIKDRNFISEAESTQQYLQLKLLFFLKTDRFKEAESLTPEIELCLKKYRHVLLPGLYHTISFNVFLVLFGYERYSEARDWLSRISTSKYKERSDIKAFARVMELILSFEEGNHYYVETTYNAVYQSLKRKRRWGEFEKAVLNHVLKLTRTTVKKERTTILENLHERLIQIKKENKGTRLTFLQEVAIWCQSKATGKPYFDIVMDMKNNPPPVNAPRHLGYNASKTVSDMKNWMFLFVFFVGHFALPAAAPGHAEPEEIEPITKVTYPFDYYSEQAGLWKKETEKDRLDANAWLNYFRAARYANLLSDSPEKPFDTDAIVGQMPTELANTFEFHYMLFLRENGINRNFSHLLKAYELAPERADAYHSLINYHVVKGEWDKAKSFCEKLFAAGEFSPALLAWNYNALASVEPDAILLTHGDNDTYPAWVMQGVKGVRPDVEVINVHLLFYDEYRERIFAQMGIGQIDSSDYLAYQDMYLAITRSLMGQGERPVYLGTAIPEFLRKALGDSLYLTGLAFKHSPQPFDNMALLKNNFEKRFLLDHLKIQLEADTGSNVSASMNLHYLPALIMLHRHYAASGEERKAIELEAITMQVAREGGREEELSAYFHKKRPVPDDFETTISARELDKTLVKVKDGLYAFSTEVTNEQYEAFLMDLVKNREFGLLEICKAPKTDWRSLLPENHRDLPDAEVFRHAHPNDPNAPVQNISYEAARHYCEWITKVYNRSTEKRKEHKSVQFRLPTEQEWEYAAHARHEAPFPWGGYYIRNTKGCYLSNFNVNDDGPCKDCPQENATKANDGGFFAVHADAYFPNDFGLYNASGNVAEMVAEKGLAKGGSWEDVPEECTIFSKKNYDAPSPAIGFRVFMEVE